ncbi:hypothetical protein LSTR_LSTR000294 [Laodelphax striatellus]|uniref:Uncharacterized protein n=1 Tax=Laodelphax striatellus TaxID=195883 RepID=A0A482X810_LAOST|nr:hypothetical protein LSTR_LSTR000294 [Laodelphax striatellus]
MTSDVDDSDYFQLSESESDQDAPANQQTRRKIRRNLGQKYTNRKGTLVLAKMHIILLQSLMRLQLPFFHSLSLEWKKGNIDLLNGIRAVTREVEGRPFAEATSTLRRESGCGGGKRSALTGGTSAEANSTLRRENGCGGGKRSALIGVTTAEATSTLRRESGCGGGKRSKRVFSSTYS